MKCPYCGSLQSSVKDSKQYKDARYRKYLCNACGKRYDTVERVMKGQKETEGQKNAD